MGPIILDLEGLTLSDEEKEILQHPQLGGIIFFSRNYQSPQQLTALISQIHAASPRQLLLTVDQEGGRVQRFFSERVPLPALSKLGQLYERDPVQAIQLANLHGWLMASELLALGIDLSFAPLLDLNNVHNTAIGTRALHANPNVVVILGHSIIRGIHQAGLCAVGKHFPGHGSVKQDTHTHIAVDRRDYKAIAENDLIPFAALCPYLDGMMASHIVYSEVDPRPCGFSAYWLQTILRKKLKFSGAIFTDDLSMQAVNTVDVVERVECALQAGCDGILICNNRKDTVSALNYLERHVHSNRINQGSSNRLQKLFSRCCTPSLAALRRSTVWNNAVSQLMDLNDN